MKSVKCLDGDGVSMWRLPLVGDIKNSAGVLDVRADKEHAWRNEKGIIHDGEGEGDRLNPGPNRIQYFCLCQPLFI